MKFEYRIKEIIQGGIPANLCNGTLSLIDLANVTLKVTCGSVVLVDTADLSTWSDSGDLTVQDNKGANVTVKLAKYGVTEQYIKLIDTNPDTYINTSRYLTLNIEIGKTNYRTYQRNGIRVYGYDVGYGLVPTDNVVEPIDFVLVPTAHDDQPYSSFITYPIPYSKQIEVLKTDSSYFTSVTFSNNRTTLSTVAGKLCNDGSEITHTTYIHNGIGDEAVTCTKTKEGKTITWLPTSVVDIPCDSCDPMVIASPYNFKLDLNRLAMTPFDINGTEDAMYPYIHIRWEVYNNNLVIKSGKGSIVYDSNTADVISYISDNIDILYPGDFIIKYDVCLAMDEEGNDVRAYYSDSAVFTSCYQLTISKSECSNYTITSYNVSDLPYTITKYDPSTDAFIEHSEGTLYALSDNSITLNDDGIFSVNVEVNEAIQHYMLFNHCQLDTCLIKYMDMLISCKSKCDPSYNCDANKLYDFNVITELKRMYLQYINLFQTEGYYIEVPNVLTPLAPSQLAQLHRIDDISTKMYEYCSECNSPCGCSEGDNVRTSTNCSDC